MLIGTGIHACKLMEITFLISANLFQNLRQAAKRDFQYLRSAMANFSIHIAPPLIIIAFPLPAESNLIFGLENAEENSSRFEAPCARQRCRNHSPPNRCFPHCHAYEQHCRFRTNARRLTGGATRQLFTARLLFSEMRKRTTAGSNAYRTTARCTVSNLPRVPRLF